MRSLRPSFSMACLLVLLAAGATRAAETIDVLPVLYVATPINVGGSTSTALMPRPMARFDTGRYVESLQEAFRSLKAEHPTDYGTATLEVPADVAKTRRVTLNLDAERKDGFDLVTSEVFHTMRTLGVQEVRAPLLGNAPVDDSALRLPVFLANVPFHDALPPRAYPHGMIVLGPGDIVPAATFYVRLKAGDKALIDRMLSGLRSPSEGVRTSVLAAIPHLNIPNRAAVLMPLLSDQSAAMRLAVIKLLEGETSKEVNNRLGQVAETDPDSGVKLAAVRILSSRGISKYDAFIEMGKLSDGSDSVVIGAIQRLAASKNASVASSMLPTLRHPSPAVREAARDAIVSLNAAPVLIEAMDDDSLDMPTREQFAHHLSDEGAPADAMKGLGFLVASGSNREAIWAVTQMGKKTPAGGLQALYPALLRPEDEVRAATARAIGAYRSMDSLKPLLASARTDTDRNVVDDVASGILATQSLDTILNLMEGQDPGLRRIAMKTLSVSLKGAPPPPRAIAVLEARLLDQDLGIRRAAVYALARVPDERVATNIMKLSQDPDAEIREAAVVAAGRSQDARAQDILKRALADESDRVKVAALDGVLAKQIKGAREAVQMLVSYQDVEVRRRAVKASIDLMEPGEAVESLDLLSSLLYDQDVPIKLAAIKAISTVRDRRAIVAISGVVIDRSAEVKLAALDALAATGDKEALEGIQKAVFDDDKTIRIAALNATEKLGRKEAIDFLNELLRLETDPDIHAKAEAVVKALIAL